MPSMDNVKSVTQVAKIVMGDYFAIVTNAFNTIQRNQLQLR